MPFVLDTSIACDWALKDEMHPTAARAFEHARADIMWVPALWWFEIRNALVMNERRKRITETETGQFLGEMGHLALQIDRMPDEAKVLALAREYTLTVYDSAYLELALRLKLALATLDKELILAARAEKVALIGG